ncbi:MAG: O-antigen ligase family protein [Cryomorphaceae bacterium]
MSHFDRHKIFLYQNYLLYAIAFLIPIFPRLVPVLIVLFGGLSVFAIAKGYSRVEMSEVSILLLIFFVLHLIGMLYTENLSRGWFDIEVKLSLMAFPLAFVGFRFVNTTNFNRTLRMFLYGTLTASLYCIAQSAFKVFWLDMRYYHFITSRFSVTVHQSYFALYLIFAMVILAYLEWPLVKKNRRKTLTHVLIIITLSVSVLLTGSKTGFIMWAVIALGLTGVFVREMKHKWVPILGLTVLMSIMGAIFQGAPLLQSRITNMLEVAQKDEVNPESTESTAVRYLVYSSTFEVLRSQDWYGQGTGDFQDVLDAVYNKKKYTSAAEEHLNAHNLFLQSWISLGIPGLIIILGVFLVMMVQAVRNQDALLLGFTALFFILSMTESTFNVQAGVVFFSFFTVFLARRSGAKVGSLDEQDLAET